MTSYTRFSLITIIPIDPVTVHRVEYKKPFNMLVDWSGNVKWWSRAGSNRRPLDCQSSALPAELRPPIFSESSLLRMLFYLFFLSLFFSLQQLFGAALQRWFSSLKFLFLLLLQSLADRPRLSSAFESAR